MTVETDAAETLTAHLPLGQGLDGEPASALSHALSELDGVVACDLDHRRTHLRVRYDVTLTGLDAILQVLDRFGLAPAPGLGGRLRFGLYRFREQNMRANARAPTPACCNHPPEVPTKSSSADHL
jgi:hypothetical protein